MLNPQEQRAEFLRRYKNGKVNKKKIEFSASEDDFPLVN